MKVSRLQSGTVTNNSKFIGKNKAQMNLENFLLGISNGFSGLSSDTSVWYKLVCDSDRGRFFPGELSESIRDKFSPLLWSASV